MSGFTIDDIKEMAGVKKKATNERNAAFARGEKKMAGRKRTTLDDISADVRRAVVLKYYLLKDGRIVEGERNINKKGNDLDFQLPYLGRIGKKIFQFERANDETKKIKLAIHATKYLMTFVFAMNYIALYGNSEAGTLIKRTNELAPLLKKYLELEMDKCTKFGTKLDAILKAITKICNDTTEGAEDADIKKAWMFGIKPTSPTQTIN